MTTWRLAQPPVWWLGNWSGDWYPYGSDPDSDTTCTYCGAEGVRVVWHVRWVNRDEYEYGCEPCTHDDAGNAPDFLYDSTVDQAVGA